MKDIGPIEQKEVIEKALKELTKKSIEQSTEQKLFERYLEGRTMTIETNIAEMLSD